ncbi:hypothetical protein SDC9_201566 [bioreactor metagenome]|uniref:Uncharacterized protein n=1 Tax=bioreactor metagenome TaxID=1076179 RepID=A0A645IRB2_9ZZZZ
MADVLCAIGERRDLDRAQFAEAAVVKAHNRDILRHADAEGEQQRNQTKGDFVVIAHDGGAFRNLSREFFGEELLAGFGRIPEDRTIGNDPPRVAQGCDIAGIPLVPLNIVALEDARDRRVPFCKQMLSQRVSAAIVICIDTD